MTQERLELLREALPYIRRFKGKTLVVKLSGQVTEDSAVVHSLGEEVALCSQVGLRMVVVHGGGKQLTELAERLGVRQTIVQGRRITDTDTLEIAKMVFAGKINTEIISAFRRMGVSGVGLSGLDGGIIRARRREIQRIMNRDTGVEETIDFGHVGDIIDVDRNLLELLLERQFVPVVSSLGADDEGNIYNINADAIASEIAVSLGAEKLILMTNVDGLYEDLERPETKLSRLSLQEAESYLESAVISGGMVPKLTAIVSLLKRGIKAAHIINGRRRNALLQEIFTDQGQGTMITG